MTIVDSFRKKSADQKQKQQKSQWAQLFQPRGSKERVALAFFFNWVLNKSFFSDPGSRIASFHVLSKKTLNSLIERDIWCLFFRLSQTTFLRCANFVRQKCNPKFPWNSSIKSCCHEALKNCCAFCFLVFLWFHSLWNYVFRMQAHVSQFEWSVFTWFCSDLRQLIFRVPFVEDPRTKNEDFSVYILKIYLNFGFAVSIKTANPKFR